MLAFTAINLWGVRRLSDTNTVIVWWKIAIPILAIVTLIVTQLHSSNPGWQKLVAFITSASVIIYAAQCLSFAAMRRQIPDHPRPFRLRGGTVLAPIGFVISNLIVLFAGWTTDWKLFAAIGIGLVLLAVSQAARPAAERVQLDWRSSVWLWPWLVGLGVLSYLSSFPGGKGDLHFGVDMAVTAAFSVLIYAFALARRLPDDVARERLQSGADESATG